MKKKILLTALFFMFVFSSLSHAQSADSGQLSLIQTQGQAEVFGQNDSARISFSVITEGETLDAVSSENTDKTNAVLAALKRLIIKNMDIETSSYQVTPKRDYKARPPVMVGYEVQNTIEARIEKLEPKLLSEYSSRIIAAAIENGANRVSNITFYIKDIASLENKALAEATRKAQKRAEVLAGAAGVKIKKIVNINTQPSAGTPAPRMMRSSAMMAESGAVAPPIETGDSSIRMQVNMSFEIE